MRKSNYNFVLSPNNIGEFIKRFNRLINLTDCLSEQTIYHSKEISKFIDNSYINILKSTPCYLLKEKISFDTYPSTIGNMERYDCFNEWKKADGIIIRIHFDACITFYWGQKFKFTPTQIKTIGCPKIPAIYKIKKFKNSNRKSTSIFNVFSNISLAEKSVALDENIAQDYYDNLASEEFCDF